MKPNAEVHEALMRTFNQRLRHIAGDIPGQLSLLKTITKMHRGLDMETMKMSEEADKMLEIAERSRMGKWLIGLEVKTKLELSFQFELDGQTLECVVYPEDAEILRTYIENR